MAIVYQHVKKTDNNVFYIGIGKELSRAYETSSRNPHWHAVVNKHGYEVEILFDNVTWNEACMFEKDFIHLHGRADLCIGPLVNMTNGGDGSNGYRHSEEHKRKISKLRKGSKHSEESRIKMRKPKAPRTEEHNLNSSIAHKKPVKQINRYTKEVVMVWDSGLDAYNVTGIRHINEVCLGKRKTAGGYCWEFVK